MSRNKIPLSFERQRRKSIWLLWPAVAIALLSFFIGMFVFKEDGAEVVVAEPIESLAMQDIDYLPELNRQEFAQDFERARQLPEEKVVEHIDPFLIKGRVNKNQTLFVALKNHGLDMGDIHQVIASMQGVVDFKRTKPGDQYSVHLDANRRVIKFVYQASPENIGVAERDGQSFTAYKLDVKKRTEELYLTGTLSSSLYQAFVDLGESGELAAHFMQLFKYDFDFGTQSQLGDQFAIQVEKITLNGEFYRYGRVKMASYDALGHGIHLEAYYYDGDQNHVGYYDANGRALKRSFLKTPVVGCTITSPFNLKRMHPILKRVRPHYGIDWAGPTGTPIMAFADGTVSFAGWKGGNGNLLVIEHAKGYTSLYAHLHGFARGIKTGAKVKQGQVVATLGNTGISTGPHLHFGVKKNGKYIDPAQIDATISYTLSGAKLAEFQLVKNNLQEMAQKASERSASSQNAKAETASDKLLKRFF